MCGRFSLGVDADELRRELEVELASVAAEVEPRYNIAPTQQVPAVVRGPDGLRLGSLRWGLVPYWSRDPSDGARMINARGETVSRKPAFMESFRSRRCWVLADGFYEWRREPGGGRTAMHVRLPGARPFVFAGLWDRWEGDDGPPLHTCTILTTEPSEPIRAIHDRMPVILPPESRDVWLEPAASPEELKALLRPYDGELEVFAVSDRVNSPGNDDPSCRAPV